MRKYSVMCQRNGSADALKIDRPGNIHVTGSGGVRTESMPASAPKTSPVPENDGTVRGQGSWDFHEVSSSTSTELRRLDRTRGADSPASSGKRYCEVRQHELCPSISPGTRGEAGRCRCTITGSGASYSLCSGSVCTMDAAVRFRCLTSVQGTLY